MVEEVVLRLLGDTGRVTESRLDTVIFSVICTVVDSACVKSFQRSSFQTTMNRVVQKHVVELYMVDAVATCTIDFRVFIIPVPKFVKYEVETSSLEMTEMEERYN